MYKLNDIMYAILYNNLKNSCDFIRRGPWSIRGQTHGITSQFLKCRKYLKTPLKWLNYIQIEGIHGSKSININKYLRQMCKTHSQKLANSANLNSFRCDFKIRSSKTNTIWVIWPCRCHVFQLVCSLHAT